MIDNQLAARYGQALFQLAREKDKLTVFNDQLQEISRLLDENEDLKKVLYHQKILAEEKKEVLASLFAEQLDQYVLNFLYLLIDKRREYFLQNIIREFKKRVNEDEQILEVEVVSAIELDQELKDQLVDRLDQLLDYSIILEEHCDPSIIGGLKLKINDYVVDGSIKNRLESLRSRLNNIPVSELGVEL